ncbi:MAG: hypothetical protein M3Z50_14845 [Actinomycetota bacterium]|nr:hypothetical protein [Actinomycetota bacterium]
MAALIVANGLVTGGFGASLPGLRGLLGLGDRGVDGVRFGLAEETAMEWSSLHVTDATGVSPSAGARGLACVSGFHGRDSDAG